MPQLDISTFLPQLFWLFICFGLLYLLLSKICIPQLDKIFAKRDSKISEDLAAAHKAKEEALKLKITYEKALAKAIQTKSEMLEQGAKELAKIAEDKLAELDKELAAMISNSEKKMSSFRKSAETDVEKIAKEAATLILNKLSNSDVKEKTIAEAIKNSKEDGSYVL